MALKYNKQKRTQRKLISGTKYQKRLVKNPFNFLNYLTIVNTLCNMLKKYKTERIHYL